MNRQQKIINEVVGKILCEIAENQDLNVTPVCLSIGGYIRGRMTNNCIMLYSAPMEVVCDLKFLEEMYPGVMVSFDSGRVIIDCENVFFEMDDTLCGRMKRLVGAV